MHKVLFVCLGNICRSPTAEGVFRKKIQQRKLDHLFDVDSAGTMHWHIGKSPDKRSVAAAKDAGYDLSALRGRQVQVSDFEHYDHILAMDHSNVDDLVSLCASSSKEKSYLSKIELFLDYARAFSEREVPDPYYGGNQGFMQVINMIEDASDGFLDKIIKKN